MSNVPETSAWESGVYQFETTDLIQGGPGGVDNLPHQQLGNRTKWLYDNKLTKTGNDTMVGRLTLSPTAGDALVVATQNGVNAVIRLTQASQSSVSFKALASGAFSIGVDSSGGDTERIRVDNAGRVGIGTLPSTSSMLKVAGSIECASTSNFVYANNYGSVTSSSVMSFLSNNQFVWGNTLGTEFMRIDASGRLGVGTATPTYLGEFVKTSGAAQVGLIAANNSYSELYFGDTDSKTIGALSYSHSNNSLSHYVNGAERMRIDASGNVGIGIAAPNNGNWGRALSIGSTTNSAFEIVNNGAQSAFFAAGGSTVTFGTGQSWPVAFFTGGVERLRIDASGLVTHDTPSTAASGRESVTASWVRQQNYITSGGAPVQSVAGRGGAVTLSTSDVSEGANLYYTNARASAAAPVQSVAGKTGAVTLSTSDVSEASNLYFTNARASAAAPVQSVNGRTGAVSGLTETSAFTNSLSGKGYQKLQGGLILQWGTLSGSTTGINVSDSFAIAFPNACLSAQITNSKASWTAVIEMGFVLNGVSSSSITAYLDRLGDGGGGVGQVDAMYFAIGY